MEKRAEESERMHMEDMKIQRKRDGDSIKERMCEMGRE